jgi:hypothetical protein
MANVDGGDLIKQHVKEWVAEEISRVRSLSYGEIRGHLDAPIHLVQTVSGKPLVRETQVFWDGGKNGPLRVMVDVLDPGSGGKRRWWRGVRSLAI